MKKYSHLVISSIAILIIATATLLMVFLTPEPKKLVTHDTQESYSFGGDFVLTDQDGNKFDSKDYHDKILLVYFGFSSCPDICYISLHKIDSIIDKYNNNRLQAIFITIDPKKDTPSVLKSYLSQINPKIIGLTGTEQEVNHVANLFKVSHINTLDPSSQQQTINHSSLSYILQKGKLVKFFSDDEKVGDIVREMKNMK